MIELTESQRRFHQEMLESPNAPRYNFQSSDMLTEQDLAEVRGFEKALWSQKFWASGEKPDWLSDFTEQVSCSVPFYRSYGTPPKDFEAFPPFSREVLRDQPWSLVPDSLALEALTVYTTSGTTGTRLVIPTHPKVSSLLLVLMDKLLSTEGMALPRGVDQVAITLLSHQRETLTYAALTHTLDGAGFLKLNLAPHEWRDPEHRAAFLLEMEPAVVSGSPHAFTELQKICPELRPRALINTAVALHPGLKKSLEEQFACPVFDVYSMTEARFIAGGSTAGEYPLLSPDLFVEILGPNDEVLPEGVQGEIVLTGGRNVYFPLLRYRTGDRAALNFRGNQPYLTQLEGRAAVHLENGQGKTVSTLDVVHALRELPLIGFSLHQDSERGVKFRYAGATTETEVRQNLEQLFETRVSVVQASEWDGKPQRFGSELGSV